MASDVVTQETITVFSTVNVVFRVFPKVRISSKYVQREHNELYYGEAYKYKLYLIRSNRPKAVLTFSWRRVILQY